MKYKVGDKVRLKEGLEHGKDYGDAFYVDELDEYLGKDLIITSVHSDGDCYDFECDGEKSYLALTDEMLQEPKLRLIDVMNMIADDKFEENWKVKVLPDEVEYTFKKYDEDEIELYDKYGISIFEENYLSVLKNEVEIIKTQGEKEKNVSKEIDELRVQIVDSDGDLEIECIHAMVQKMNELICRFNSEVINK